MSRPRTAAEWRTFFRKMREGAEHGFVEHQCGLGEWYLEGFTLPSKECLVRRSKKLGRLWLEKAARSGHAHALFRLGTSYDDDGDHARAIDYWRRSHRAGHDYAATNVALTYRQLGNRRRMMIWLRRAVERDDYWGAVNLARIHLFDRGTRAQQTEAIALLRHYARSRDVEADEAMLALADALDEGHGVARSATQAAAWRARAARHVEREIARGRILDDA